MRILLLAPQPFFEIRGTPLAIRNMIRVLCGRGYSVDLITYPIGCDIEMENLRIIRIPRIIPVKEVGIGLSVRKIIFDLCLTYVASQRGFKKHLRPGYPYYAFNPSILFQSLYYRSTLRRLSSFL
jgi:hypothetical protein